MIYCQNIACVSKHIIVKYIRMFNFYKFENTISCRESSLRIPALPCSLYILLRISSKFQKKYCLSRRKVEQSL